jgi:hypothetical protein
LRRSRSARRRCSLCLDAIAKLAVDRRLAPLPLIAQGSTGYTTRRRGTGGLPTSPGSALGSSRVPNALVEVAAI